eukprot:877094-Rhodomonas_salina.2
MSRRGSFAHVIKTPRSTLPPATPRSAPGGRGNATPRGQPPPSISSHHSHQHGGHSRPGQATMSVLC